MISGNYALIMSIRLINKIQMREIPYLSDIPKKYHSVIREKAINRARTRIVVAGGDPANFKATDLEVVVKEEEDKIKSSIREKGLLAILALFGLNFFS